MNFMFQTETDSSAHKRQQTKLSPEITFRLKKKKQKLTNKKTIFIDETKQKLEESISKNKELESEIKSLKEENNSLVKEKERCIQILEKLREKVECPICFMLPTTAPVMCPNGHFVCHSCQRKRHDLDCPTCRVLMPPKRIHSLLASIVIENSNHECSHQGCKEMLAFENLKEHKKVCRYRPVLCPGRDDELIPYADLGNHLKNCKAISFSKEAKTKFAFSLSRQQKENGGDVSWKANTFCHEKYFCILKAARVNLDYRVDLIVDETVEICDQLVAEISIVSSKSRAVFKSCFSPRPFTQDKWGSFYLSFTEAALEKIWEYDGKNDQYVFTVEVKIVKTM